MCSVFTEEQTPRTTTQTCLTIDALCALRTLKALDLSKNKLSSPTLLHLLAKLP